MNLHQIFKPEVTKEGYAAREVATGDLAEDGLIRDIQIKNALRHDQLLRVDGVTGRVRRISKEEGKQEAESIGKMEFKVMRAETDPTLMFTNLERLTGMVAKGIQPSLVVTGMPGLGKTYLVKKKLEEMGLNESRDFVHFKGRSTAAGLFITLFENRNRVIVFDDCDSVFKDDDAVNMLKAALDSYDSRHISYISSKPLKDPEGDPLPSIFEFTGQIIFISNISQSKLDPAIQSRSFVQDISMTTDQMFQRIESLIGEIEPRIPIDKKKYALELMKDIHSEYRGVEINLRSFIKAARVACMEFDDPKIMIAEQIIPAS